jgi:hypothetical protein
MKNILIVLMILCQITTIYSQNYVSEQGKQKREEAIKLLENKSFWKKYNSSGKDKENKNADFEILILTQNENWRLGDEVNVQSGDINIFFPKYLKGRMDMLMRADDIICVGTASLKGATTAEIKRAGTRANNIARVVDSFTSKEKIDKPIYTLNLGKFIKQSETKDSAFQRPVIIILTNRTKNPDVNLNEALGDALNKIKEVLVINIEDYNKSNNLKLEKYK